MAECDVKQWEVMNRARILVHFTIYRNLSDYRLFIRAGISMSYTPFQNI